MRRYITAAKAARAYPSCAECGVDHLRAREHGPLSSYRAMAGPAGTRTKLPRDLARSRNRANVEACRRTLGDADSSTPLAQSRRHAKRDHKNIERLYEEVMNRIRGGETVLCGICHQPICEPPIEDGEKLSIDRLLGHVLSPGGNPGGGRGVVSAVSVGRKMWAWRSPMERRSCSIDDRWEGTVVGLRNGKRTAPFPVRTPRVESSSTTSASR